MDSIPQVIVVSDSANQSPTCSVLDMKNGSVLHAFKDGKSTKKCLSFIGQDYIISALRNQPALKVWILNKTVPDVCNMVIPGIASSLDVSTCGEYCVVGIDCSFYVWEVETGILLSSVGHHSKPITCVKFSPDGSYVISAGKDGMVLVWLLTKLISINVSPDNLKPRHVWLDHAAEVTDVHIGSSGAHVVTVSKDMTCRIYELASGRLLTTINVDFDITAVTTDAAEFYLMLGSSDGNIHRVNLFSNNESDIKYSDTDRKSIYAGHSKEITCLSVSIGGKYLVSGSEDGELRLWEIDNFTCVRKQNFQGAVTNAFIALCPPGLKNELPYSSRLKVSVFNRHYENNDGEYVMSKIQDQKLSLWNIETPNDYFDSRVLNYSEESLSALCRNIETEKKMSVINQQMYSYALSDTYSIADRPTSPEDFD